MYYPKLKTMGSYLPNNKISNDDLAQVVDTTDEWIRSRTGIQNRYISENENTSDMAAEAAAKVLEKEAIDPLKIEVIIVATMTPDYLTPSTACLVQKKIEAKNAFAFDINAACTGFIFALSIGQKLLSVYDNILVIGAETMSKATDWNDRSTCVLFGDGAAGALLQRTQTKKRYAESLKSQGENGHFLTAGYFPQTGMSDEIMEPSKIQMNGREIFNFAVKEVPRSIQEVLKKEELTLNDIKYIIPHQANYRIVEAIAKKLKVSLDKFYMCIDEFGNTSAASIPLALCRMSESSLLSEGDLILLCGFGGGLTYGTILLEI